MPPNGSIILFTSPAAIRGAKGMSAYAVSKGGVVAFGKCLALEVSVKNYPLFDYPPYETSLTSKLVEIVKFEKLDLLHVHYAIPHASCALLAKDILKTMGIEIPVITTLHGTDITLLGKDKSFKPVIEYAINKSDAIASA